MRIKRIDIIEHLALCLVQGKYSINNKHDYLYIIAEMGKHLAGKNKRIREKKIQR